MLSAMRSAYPSSATGSSHVVVFPANRCLMIPDSSPMRSIVPAAIASPPTGLTSWYLSEDNPEFMTSTDPVRAVRAVGVGALALGRIVMRRSWESEVGSAASAGACAWIAVIATVLTMSCTSAPRERSFTGLLRPWRTGPTATAPAERWTAL